MGFVPLGKTVKSLISSHNTFLIPRFQRDFSWEQKNYDEFYQDILNQLVIKEDEFKVEKYFLGNMIFQGGKDSVLVEVIDGQQRLTTITIILAALRDSLNKINTEESKNIAETIQNEYILKKHDGKIYRRLEPKTSFPYFANSIQDNDPQNDKPSSDEEIDLQKTFKFFSKKFTFENLKTDIFLHKQFDLSIDKYTEMLKTIRDQILLCEVVAIYVDNTNQANKIFENINSKGKPLSQVDLVKNYIFNHIGPSNADVDNIQEEWKKMKNKLISDELGSSNSSINFDVFFIDYIKAKYPKLNVNNKNLYEKFRRNFRTKQKINDFCDLLYKDIDLYIKIINPKIDDYRRQEKKPIYYALQAINRFKGRQVKIPLLSLFILNETTDYVKNSDMVDFIDFLAIFHFSVFGLNMKFRSNQITKPFKDFSIRLLTANNKNDVNNAMKELKEQLLDKISQDIFIEHFVDLSFDKQKARNEGNFSEFPTTYALNTIENKLSSIKVNHNDSSIEHIYDEELGETNIGNLIVLERAINDELSKIKNDRGENLSIQEKLTIYKKSNYLGVKKFLDEYNSFEKNDIEKRAEQLAKYFYETFL